jgi:hypothetical protein
MDYAWNDSALSVAQVSSRCSRLDTTNLLGSAAVSYRKRGHRIELRAAGTWRISGD